MNPPDRYSFIGRLVRPKAEPDRTFVVSDVVYDVARGEYVALLRQTSPRPSSGCSTPLSELTSDSNRRISTPRDAAALLVARCLYGAPSSQSALFFNRTTFKPYQFRPLIRYLKSQDRRILIADEPGLGKTIEAGYILVEESARFELHRVLVLCPAGLRTKWRQELWRRFGLQFDIVDGIRLSARLRSNEGFAAIASMDSLRAQSTEAIAPGQDLDMLIIDEVHHLIGRSGDTLRRKLGMELSRRSRRVVALSATPVQLAPDDLRKVLGVVMGHELDPQRFETDMEVTRLLNRFMIRARRGQVSNSDASDLRDKLSHLIGIGDDLPDFVLELGNLSKDELQLSLPRLLAELETRSPLGNLLIRNRKKDVGELRRRDVISHPVRLREDVNTGFQHGVEVRVSERSLFCSVDQMLLRSFSPVHRQQLSSCLPAMIGLMRGGMEGFPVWRSGEALLGPVDLLDADTGNRQEQAQSLSQEERDACRKLADEYLLVGGDSKWEVLKKILEELRKEPPEKAIVFTQWKPTLRHLREMASPIKDPKCFFLTGDDNDSQVENVLRGFSAHEGRAVLFATDFLAEGIDLQQADTVVNYDFPYNPMRIEQRIGRVDRIGQTSKTIHIHNIWVEGSLDAAILDILQKRLDIFEESLGDVTDILTIKPSRDSVELVSPEGWRVENIREIDRFGLFSGVEDFLDKDVEELRRRGAASFNSLLWLPVVKCLLVCAAGRARVVSDSEEVVRVGPILDDDIEVVALWAGVKDAALVKMELESYRDAVDFCISVAKIPKSRGLFISPSHPLAKIAVTVSLNSEGFTDHTRPVLIEASSVKAGVTAIFRYAAASPDGKNELAVWRKIGQSPFSRLSPESVLTFLRELRDSTSFKEHVGRWLPPQDLVEAVKADYYVWRRLAPATMVGQNELKLGGPTQPQETLWRGIDFIGAILPSMPGGFDGRD